MYICIDTLDMLYILDILYIVFISGRLASVPGPPLKTAAAGHPGRPTWASRALDE